MENFNFLTDRTPLTPEEIQAHKNFNQVLQQYNTNLPVKFYKTGWFKAGLATVTVAATGTILFFATGTNKKNEPATTAQTVTSQNPYSDESPCVKKPIAKVDVPKTIFLVDATKDTVLYYETGSALLYKANSLTTPDGKPVKGNVSIEYREFHNPIEVFASGIPMKYDSSNVHWNLKSAGMVEIAAFQNGQPVVLKNNSTMEIQLKSGTNEPGYNLYYLDTNNRNWSYEGQDMVLNNNASNKPPANSNKPKNVPNQTPQKIDTAKIKQELAKFLPVKPRHVNPKAYSFTLDVLEDEFPELTLYSSTKFEVIDDKNTFSPQIFTTEWEDAGLKEITAGEKYSLTLSRGQTIKNFTITPVLEGNDYKKALEVYHQKFKVYQEKLGNRIKEEKNKIAKEKEETTKWELEASQKHANRIHNFTSNNLPNDQVMARFSADNSLQSLVTRSFTIRQFGIWNCDKPVDFPQGERVQAVFCDEEGTPLPLSTVFLCEKQNKMMYTYSASDFNRFKFNPEQTNALWAIDKEGNLVYAKNDAFDLKNKVKNKMTFTFTIVRDKITTLKQVKELLDV